MRIRFLQIVDFDFILRVNSIVCWKEKIIKEKLSKQDKIELIQKTALTILKDCGDHYLTMRRVAAETDMSLSNVQYYFKNKNELYKGMLDFFLSKCSEMLNQFLEETINMDSKKRLGLLIKNSLGICNTDDNCKIIREISAIATHNTEVNEYLIKYYEIYAENLAKVITPLTKSKKKINQSVAIMLPYIEGYSLTGPSLNVKLEKLSELITDFVIEIIEA